MSINNIQSVSYTHLDVYKRQVYTFYPFVHYKHGYKQIIYTGVQTYY